MKKIILITLALIYFQAQGQRVIVQLNQGRILEKDNVQYRLPWTNVKSQIIINTQETVVVFKRSYKDSVIFIVQGKDMSSKGTVYAFTDGGGMWLTRSNTIQLISPNGDIFEYCVSRLWREE